MKNSTRIDRIIKSKIYDSVVFAHANLRETTLTKCVVGENTVLKKTEVTDSIIGARSEIKEGTKVKE